MSAEQRVKNLGLVLPPPPKPAGNYVPYRLWNGVLYLSGVGPRLADGGYMAGKVGEARSLEEGYEAARLCGLHLLANIRDAAGSLDRVDTVLKVFGMVNAVPNFREHPRVINGCTDLFTEVFGDNGRPARSAVGMGSLPFEMSVEVEAIVALKG